MSEREYIVDSTVGTERDGYKLVTSPPTREAVYSCGEEFAFNITLSKNGSPLNDAEIRYKLFQDVYNEIECGSVKIKNGQATVTAKSDRPDFIMIKAYANPDGKGEMETGCGAGIEPLKIEAGTQMPEDLDEFWSKQKTKLAQIPLAYKMTRIDKNSHPKLHDYSHKALLEHDTTGILIDDITIDSLGKPVSGIIARPERMEKGKHPLALFVQGAGVIPTQPHNFIHYARRGCICLEINAHGIPNLEKLDYYEDLRLGKMDGYSLFGRERRETSYFLGMFLRLQRAIDYLTSLPEWDGEKLITSGGSQGGAQAVAAAYIDRRVTAFYSRVTAMCDHEGREKGHTPGWPRMVKYDDNGNPDPDTQQTARYYDCVNYLRKIDCEGVFCTGFMDGACTPCSVYAAYNAFGGTKTMFDMPFEGHNVNQETADRIEELSFKYLGI